MNIQPRILCHFSCGAASAVATKLALDKYGADSCEIINIHIAEEHPDNQRFLKDCERWFGKTITIKIHQARAILALTCPNVNV